MLYVQKSSVLLWISTFQRATQRPKLQLTDNIRSGGAVVSTITSVNTELSSLRKQPTFGGATTCFPAKSWHVRNERRNSILMTHPLPDLGCPSDWLKQVSYRGTTNQKHTQIWVVTCHQYGILRSFLRRHFAGKPAVVSRNVSYFLKLQIRLPLTVASSPSGWAIAWYALGETQIGMLNLWPRTVTEMSWWDTSRSIRGRSLILQIKTDIIFIFFVFYMRRLKTRYVELWCSLNFTRLLRVVFTPSVTSGWTGR